MNHVRELRLHTSRERMEEGISVDILGYQRFETLNFTHNIWLTHPGPKKFHPFISFLLCPKTTLDLHRNNNSNLLTSLFFSAVCKAVRSVLAWLSSEIFSSDKAVNWFFKSYKTKDSTCQVRDVERDGPTGWKPGYDYQLTWPSAVPNSTVRLC